MAKNGIDIAGGTNGLSTEHLKAQLEYETNSKKLSNEFWQSLTENLFSSNFLVFIVTCIVISSGFVYMGKTSSQTEILDYWKLILPVVTTYIGYAIGKSKSK
ncbi:hypothetical protein [Azotobacter chroococcum]|uniref:Uncharacterized protein n=1 Tax=Azotobacter chroococcum TaxID=353 RepID=A0AAP9YDW8_9GAMM|nr:hypothetical protein [Azotobacter chroococcum]QQE88868.1 hypothetical protein GKQ51_00290 [Azotobacter chroococcum]